MSNTINIVEELDPLMSNIRSFEMEIGGNTNITRRGNLATIERFDEISPDLRTFARCINAMALILFVLVGGNRFIITFVNLLVSPQVGYYREMATTALNVACKCYW